MLNEPNQEVLTFILGQEHYGLDIMCVKEIRAFEPVTQIANTPDYFLGVLNLRGDVVPIIDFRIRFNVGEPSYSEFTIVIMLTVSGKTVGIVVDAVSDVLNISEANIKPAPEITAAFDVQFVRGLVPLENLMLILIDIEKLLTSEDLGLFEQASTHAQE